MKWFQGNISSAIQTAKANKSVFIVYIASKLVLISLMNLCFQEFWGFFVFFLELTSSRMSVFNNGRYIFNTNPSASEFNRNMIYIDDFKSGLSYPLPVVVVFYRHVKMIVELWN